MRTPTAAVGEVKGSRTVHTGPLGIAVTSSGRCKEVPDPSGQIAEVRRVGSRCWRVIFADALGTNARICTGSFDRIREGTKEREVRRQRTTEVKW